MEYCYSHCIAGLRRERGSLPGTRTQMTSLGGTHAIHLHQETGVLPGNRTQNICLEGSHVTTNTNKTLRRRASARSLQAESNHYFRCTVGVLQLDDAGCLVFFPPGMESNHHFPTKPAGCPAVGRRRSNQAVSSRQMPRTPFPASGVEPLHLGLQPRVLPLDDEGKEMREKKRKVKNKWKKPAEFTVCAKTPSPLPESNRDFVLRRHAFLSNYTKRAGAPMQGVEP